MSNNYQPADWPGSNQWSRLQNRANDGVFEGRYSYADDQDYDFNQLSAPTQTQSFINQPQTYYNQPQQYGPQYGPQYGRRCYVVCEPVNRPRHPRNPREIARLLIGRSLQEAQRIHPNIRVVVRDGQNLVITHDHRPDRINVETRNNIVVRILGFY
ncbi:hypothetical protein QJ857_gp1290 [Tupanvirus soda lake]|uniref:Uncharacterized protein n=2 Tax=Tupanvirus TaxID=2094720 RepID=A0A6N1NX02_9VIRU|nr:hypothetical protein QJ857_gp1290 [Tupanvirus soda lake]QKU34772.1 hypothetical protein [Tupanvirus soda lake]